MPIRSPRKLYEINLMTRNLDDHLDRIDKPNDELPGNTEIALLVKIKKGIGDYFGLQAIAPDDPRFIGTFKTDDTAVPNPAQLGATNAGANYHRRIGGFKVSSFKLLPITYFDIAEDYYDRANDSRVTQKKRFQSMSIGFPTGAKVWQFKRWLATLPNADTVRAFVTPNGHKIDFN